MNRRNFFQWVSAAFPLLFLEKKLTPSIQDDTEQPLHECVDSPMLPCPACLKWTGDAYATERSQINGGRKSA
jgi:hypothetical protein